VPDQQATPLTEFRFRFDDVVVFGSEGRGISPELLALCGERVTIPQRGVTQSLNLGVATGIILFEFLRQEDAPGKREPR
jgi:tRNA G18 (ribose-2'-O)-methylase SpoU